MLLLGANVKQTIYAEINDDNKNNNDYSDGCFLYQLLR